MAIYIRGANPIWSMVDLQGLQFDDTFYMYVLENEIPYLPARVYHTPSGTPWTNPIRFLANGTLPIDIFWNSDEIYRLEFRQNVGPLPPSQDDPLIYLVENYDPGNGGSNPIDAVGLFSDNQITNPQFANILFSSPYEVSSLSGPVSIEVSPGWFLDLTGIGNVTLTQVPLDSSVTNPTNAPYALRIQLSGTWTGTPVLRQRFNQNGVLWASKWVSSSVTARVESDVPIQITGLLVDSQGAPLVEVLRATINSTFNEYRGHGFVPVSTNTDTPPDAWIDFKITLPTTTDIFLTSIQLVESDAPLEYAYEQDTVERQIDHNFHYYFDSVVFQAKSSILTGWSFSLNPYQFITSTLTTVTNQCQYIADQTILYQANGGSTVLSGQSPASSRAGLAIKAVASAADNRFAIIQYIDPATCRSYWGYLMSALVRARISTTHGTEVGIKVRLIVSTTLPATINSTNPIVSWTGTDPVFAGQWTAIVPENDPVYILQNSQGANGAFDSYSFIRMLLSAMATTTQVLGIVVYTTNDLNSSSGTEDYITFDEVSLVPNEFACATNVKTFDQVLQECQFYYEKSFPLAVLPGTASADGYLSQKQGATTGGLGVAMEINQFTIDFNTVKRAIPAAGNMTIYSAGSSGAADNIRGIIYTGGAPAVGGTGDISVSTYFTFSSPSQKRVTYIGHDNGVFFGAVGSINNLFSLAQFHYTADVRLGI